MEKNGTPRYIQSKEELKEMEEKKTEKKEKKNEEKKEEIKEKIELRSENTRMFIAEEPPLIVRIGTVAITLVIACVFLAACFVRINGKTLWEWIVSG